MASERRAMGGEKVAKLSNTELRAWRGFLHTHDDLWKALDARLASAFDLSIPGYELLLALEEAGGGGVRMAELAKRLRFSAGGLTRLVDKLQDAGLTERRKCEVDGRGFYVHLTLAGRRHLRRVHVKHLEAVRALFLDKLTPGEQAALAEIWDKLLTTRGA